MAQFCTPEDWKFQHHCCENVKPYEVLAVETSLHERSRRGRVHFCNVNAESSCLWCEIHYTLKEQNL